MIILRKLKIAIILSLFIISFSNVVLSNAIVFEGKIQKNIYVKDINISNLTKEEAKEKINKNNNLDEKQILNQELKIRLNNTIRDISRVAGLMANNTIIDEDTLSLVKKLKNELRFLNEQTELYSSQQKF